MDEEEFNKGIILPQLLTQLRKILDQYPDDTQIFKELVQNADDAGAREIKFLYDRRSYGADHNQLHNPGFSKYQGPALYAYNDGVFDDSDWRGLRMICESVKQEDPFKVGYFGMGFKSVFHFTDLPSVLSGNKLAYIDPQQQLFEASSFAWNLKKHPELLDDFRHQLDPYLGIFDCNETTFTDGFYGGTLFRFPLRLKPSILSTQPYVHEKVMALMESFLSEAHLLPLFLRHVESIEIYDRDPTTPEPRLLFSVKISQYCLDEVRLKRTEFMQRTRSREITSKPIISTYKMTVEVRDCRSSSSSSSPSVAVIYHKYLVSHYFCGGQLSAAFVKLLKDSDLNYLPWVGAAMPLTDAGAGEDAYALSPQDGRVFCFLPLGLEEGYSSGLSVHLNGFFSLEQNRKHIKWPGIYASRSREDLMDKRVLWNICLVKEVLPKCYLNLLLEAIRLNTNQTTESLKINDQSCPITEEAIYRAFPSFDSIDRRWESLLVTLCSELFKYPVVRTAAEGGKWVEPRHTVFNTLDSESEISKIVVEILLEGSVRVANVPHHVFRSIKKCQRNVVEVTPSLVANVCRSLQRSMHMSVMNRFDWNQKIELLRYFVTHNKFDALDGLDLLPLEDGTFQPFYYNPKKADRNIYISTEPEFLALLPGAEHDILAVNLDEEIKKLLMKASSKGMTQLKALDSSAIADLLPRCFPAKLRNRIGKSPDPIEWIPDDPDHPNEEWLELVWNFLLKYSPRDLSGVENLPLLPGRMFSNVSGQKAVELHPLFESRGVRMLRTNEEMQLGDQVESIVVKLGILVIPELPEYIRVHPLILRKFVFLPNYLGVLRAIGKLCEIHEASKVIKTIQRTTSDEDKRCLRELFAKISSHELDVDSRTLLQHLPLFEAVVTPSKDQSSGPRFVSFKECHVAAPVERIDFPLSSLLLDISNISSQALSKLLGVRQLNLIQLLQKVVFRDIEEAYYEQEQVKEVMLHVLKLYNRFSEPDVSLLRNSLQLLPFMQKNDLFVRASYFFNPENDLLQKLFRHEKRFPDEDYLDPLVLPALKEIGLRSLEDIEAEDIKEATETVEDLLNAVNNGNGKVTLNSIEEKSKAIVEVLQRFPEKLKEDCGSGQTLGVELRSIKWVVCQQLRPPLYPKTLPWCGCREDSSNKAQDRSVIFEMPEKVISKKYAFLAGSVLPVSSSDFPHAVDQALGWNTPPQLSNVVQHLQHVVKSYSNQEKMAYSEIVKCIYTELALRPTDDVTQAMTTHSVPDEWIWTGEGFASKDRVVFNQPFMDLRPFVWSLPVELVSYTEFLEKVADLKKSCSLVEVLKLIREKHSEAQESKHEFSHADIRKDLHICVCILNELKSLVYGCETEEKKSILLEDFKRNLNLPVLTENSNSLRLAPLTDCSYCDEEWLRQGYTSDFGGANDDEFVSISLVHPNVPASTSEALGVPTLMSRMLDAEELDISFGQSDSLTHRLNTLILEYADGFAIPKELVQNADDAGATEVYFLYDERDNDDAKSCLLDEGMKDCQGPALWVYNNAVFEDSDFENITKLNGATKLRQPDKIGRFGLGFNAVYNLTDVPSFVSRHSIVIFDPHTCHLGKSIKDKRKPGIRIDLRRHRRNLRRFGNQFKPYNDIFGCNLKPGSQGDSYDGTLFRFPLRTKSQAMRSEISSKHYDDREVKELLRMIVLSCDSLLLFSQHVIKISVFHLPKKGNPLNNIVQLFSMEKQMVKVLRELPAFHSDEASLGRERNYCTLKAAGHILKKIGKEFSPGPAKSLDSSIVVRLERKCCEAAKLEKLVDDKQCKELNTTHLWLICTCMGIGESLKMVVQDDSLTPCVSVAARIKRLEDDTFVPIQIDPMNSGSIFSFMPLPIRSGLPVHVNGAFAITSNRKFLCSKSEDDKFDLRPVWNQFLLEDAVCRTYLKTLEDLTRICSKNHSYDFFLLWPNPNLAEPCCESLLKAFYEHLTTSNNDPPALFCDGHSWAPFSRTMFLEFDLANSDIGKTAYEVFHNLSPLMLNNNSIVAMLPDWLENAFSLISRQQPFYENSFDIIRFFTEVFFPNVPDIVASNRDKLLLYALNLENEVLNSLIASNSCIPTSPDGSAMKPARSLVDPTSSVAKMFVDSDGQFPLMGSLYVDTNNLRLLRSIGIKHDVTHFSLDDLLERAQVISKMNGDEVTNKRMVSSVLSTIGILLETSDARKATIAEIRDNFLDISFLPVTKKSHLFPLPWKNDFTSGALFKPSEVFAPELFDLVCCVAPVVDIDAFPPAPHLEIVKNFFLLNSREPQIDTVLEQLDVIATNFLPQESIKSKSFDTVQRMCFKIYEFLQQKSGKLDSSSKHSLIDALRNKSFIITSEAFLSPDKVAFNFQHSNCSPYLFSIPDNLKRNFYDLFHLAGVRDHFDVSDYIRALQEISRNFHDNPLDKQTLRKSLQLVSSVGECMTEERLSLDDIVSSHGIIYIPDSENVMKPASALCYNEPDCKWLPSNDSLMFSHPLIPFTISKQLGVNTNRLEVLKKHSRGIAFGQREKLTNRIRRILSGYPCDKEILKELLQNADDAGATEICFIKDSRQHGTGRIFDKSWQSLQGPALCIYNNVAFNENDLDAIQKLGEGSKRNDPNKTGQYGVGFNCVYHLTDAPSFITCGPNITETLCVFDPHAKFVPGSTIQEPGRRFQNVGQLKSIFTDVFSCYLGDKFDLSNGTMFRLPLRNYEMAKSSEISDRALTSDDITDLFHKFSAELSDCLLFLNNIRNVTLYDIEKQSGKLTMLYKVTSNISDSDSKNLQQFSSKISSKSSVVKSGQLSVLSQLHLSYHVNISDNLGSSEKWLVSKSFGFNKNVEIPQKITDAFQRKELMLMPLAGVAALLEHDDESGQKKRVNRLFCFLPLPIKSEFPIHVNGHFAVDYEARRNLWYDENETDAKTEWNRLLFQHVVSSAYVTLLETLTRFVSKHENTNSANYPSVTVDLTLYNNLFPATKEDVPPYWEVCGVNVYQTIVANKVKVLPVYTGLSKDINKNLQIKWVSLNISDHIKPVFDNLEGTVLGERSTSQQWSTPNKQTSQQENSKSQAETLREVLTRLGYPILALPPQLLESFVKAGINLQSITPASIINYFHICSPSFAKCNLDKLPRLIADTPIGSIENLKMILRYVSMDESYFYANVEGLPLLLTADAYLRVFSSKFSVYCSEFSDIFSELGQKFAHPSLNDEFSTLQKELRCGIFAHFDIRAFSSLLPSIHSGNLCVKGGMVTGKLLQNGTFSAELLSRVWAFIRKECENIGMESIGNALQPLENWCLLPVRIRSDKSDDQFMQAILSLRHLKVVIDYSKTSIVSPTFKACLKKINVPDLDYEALHFRNGFSKGLEKSDPNIAFVRHLITSIDDPSSLLLAISHAMETHRTQLSLSDCLAILKYFASSLDTWKSDPDSVNMLRKLHVHITTDETITTLNDCEAVLLSEEIPKFNLQAWKRNNRLLFLQSNPLFNDLYTALRCRLVTPTKLYLDFILVNMKFVEQSDWIYHVQFLKDKILNSENNPDRSLILDDLHHFEFISTGGTMKKFARASDFYDPRNKVFKILFTGHPEMFPPAPFCEFKWLDFLKLVGLQFVTTKALYLKFAIDVEKEATKCPTETTVEKSRVLLNELFSTTFMSDVEFLEAISTIKFIPTAKGKPIYRNLHPGFGKSFQPYKFISFQEGIPEHHEALVWTSSYLLPQWADPFKFIAKSVPVNGDSNNQDQLAEVKQKLGSTLKVREHPPINVVISHLKNLCSNNANSVKNPGEDPEFNYYMRNETVKKIYHFLQTRLLEKSDDDCDKVAEQIEQLSKFPCIVTNMGKNFVFPKQIVIDLCEEDQILPYLYKLPTELGEFESLFHRIGVASRATSIQYAYVLNSLQKSVQKKRLHPNELRLAFKAVFGLLNTPFRSKTQPDSLSELEHLYLPTSAGCLGKSSDLIYNDEPAWTERIKKLNYPFLVNLNECGLQAKHHLEMIKLLPPGLRPKMLTEVVSEVLEDSFCSYPNVHAVADKLKYQMSSRAFSLGLARLIKHEHRKSSNKIPNEVFESIQQQLSCLQVHSVDNVQTFLFSDQRIPESECTTHCFADKIETDEDFVCWNIYINRSLKLDDELQVSLSEIINKITGGLLKNSIHYVQPILSCPPHSVSKVLDRLRIRPDRQNNNDIITSTLPVAGSLIPVEDHHLLNQDIQEFEVGEYVGYELDDELTGEATIVYAIVVRKIHPDSNGDSGQRNSGGSPDTFLKPGRHESTDNVQFCLTLKYLVNVGDYRDLVEASPADLYRFQRIDNFFKNYDSYSSPRPSPRPSPRSSPRPYPPSNTSPVSSIGRIELEKTKRNLFLTVACQETNHRPPSNGDIDDDVFPTENNSSNGRKSPSTKKSEANSARNSNPETYENIIIDGEQSLNIDEVKNELAGILEEAWQMPEAQRKKIVKRLLLKWHPDKNIDNEYFATVVTQFIYNKIETLEMKLPCPKTFEEFQSDVRPDPRNPFAEDRSFQENFFNAYQRFSEHLGRRAKEQKDQRERYKENFAREYSPKKGNQFFNFHVPPTFASTNPQPAQAKRFIRQAQEDLKAVRNDLDCEHNPAFEWACFKAHQAAEKSLKAAQFFVDASISLSHDLVILAASLEDLELRSLAQQLQHVIGNPNKLYNPEPIDFVVIPHEEYTQEMAEKSMELARLILKRVMEIIEFKE